MECPKAIKVKNKKIYLLEKIKQAIALLEATPRLPDYDKR